MAEFHGFGKDALGFLTALRFHQDRAWFEEHKPLYQSEIVAPMTALLDDLTAAFAKRRIPLKGDAKRSMFRIYRDVRFSKDKSPYKTHASAVLTRSGVKGDNGLLYVHIDPEGSFVAAGFYMLEAKDLERLRKAIAAAGGRKFRSVTGALEKGKLALGSRHQLTRVPRGFEALKGGPLEGPIRLKSFIVEEPLADRLVASDGLTDRIVDFAKRAKPLLDFGWTALG